MFEEQVSLLLRWPMDGFAPLAFTLSEVCERSQGSNALGKLFEDLSICGYDVSMLPQ
jgi:hypothetical protein